ncbi:MAG: hypothetical protein EHM41_04160 [Chloroflexi bacterium]|nr:MAG: hypothetical protein EHM41_04160 [Chloroflexota bacterium]
MEYQHDLKSLDSCLVYASTAQIVEWEGSKALMLDGLLQLDGLRTTSGSVRVQIGAEQGCYPGIAFHIQDTQNYELVYTQPHVSGLWDSIQYDAHMQGSNIWQIYHGPRYQKSAQIPMNYWFDLWVDFFEDRAVVQVNDQTPLIVQGLAHTVKEGGLGIWTYRPAYFRNFWAGEIKNKNLPESAPIQLPAGTVTEWFLKGQGVIGCEPNGVLNLNKVLPFSTGKAVLTRQIQAEADSCLDFCFGFSDEIILYLDGNEIYQGQNTFQGFGSYNERGYIEQNANILRIPMKKGRHEISAALCTTEPFGWGIAASLQGENLTVLPLH